MNQSVLKMMLGVSLAAVGYAQPVITPGSITNAAGFVSQDMPGGGIAKGAFFVIKGQRLGPATLEIARPFPFPTSLAGTSVRVTVGGTSVDAYMYYTSAAQVAAILPSNTPSGTGTVVVVYNGQTSATAPIRVVDTAFGIFSLNQGGTGPGVFQNAISGTDLRVNTLTESARPGDVAIIWGTGLGPVNTPNEAGQAPTAGDLPTPVEVYVGGVRANVTYKGRSGCCVGVDQIVFTVPATVEGCYVPVVVKTGDVVSNFTTMSVARDRGACTDPTGLTAAQLEAAQRNGSFRSGSVILTRTISQISAGGFNVELKADIGAGSFVRYPFGDALRSQGIGVGSGGLVTPGGCIVYTFAGETPLPVDVVQPVGLDAGAVINVNGPRGAKQLTRQAAAPGFYTGQLGGGTPSIPGIPGGGGTDYLEQGAYTIDNGSGGADVGAFRVTLNLPTLLNWTNMAAITSVNRATDLSITWTGGDQSGFVVIGGGSIGERGGSGFACTARANAGSFNVPSYVLSALPATTGSAIGYLSVNNTTQPATFTAPNLDLGIAAGSAGYQKTVTYR